MPDVDPVGLYGVNDATLEQIRLFYPGLKLIARGQELKLQGEQQVITSFEHKLNLLIAHQQRYGSLSERLVNKIMNPENDLPEKEDYL